MDNKILLGKVGERIYYEYYFDKTNNCFVEEEYHHEYLDTGTILDASNIVSIQHVYSAFVEYANTDGIINLLKYTDDLELPQMAENPAVNLKFLQELEEIDKALRNKLEKIDSTYIFRKQQGDIIGVLSKTRYFWVYVDLCGKRKGFISKDEAFSYILDCMRERYKSTSGIPSVCNTQLKEQKEETKKKSNRLKNFFKKK